MAEVLYRTIVADPPWPYQRFPSSSWKHRQWRAPLPYSFMSVDAIRDLPVRDLVETKGCRLFLWATNRYLPDAYSVAAAWGFKYKQTLVWRKTGNPSPLCGALAPNAEFLVVATRGSVRRLGTLPEAVIDGPAAAAVGSHSTKPELFLDEIERMSPGPYLELFARRQRLGWDTWGDQALPHVRFAGDEPPAAQGGTASQVPQNDAPLQAGAVTPDGGRQPEVGPICDGSSECKASPHIHGCFSDRGDCDDPFAHASNRLGAGPQ